MGSWVYLAGMGSWALRLIYRGGGQVELGRGTWKEERVGCGVRIGVGAREEMRARWREGRDAPSPLPRS